MLGHLFSEKANLENSKEKLVEQA